MTEIVVRPALPTELAALNRVVEAAFLTWDLPERVKRLSLPSYRYDAADLQHLHIELAERAGEPLAVAAWEEAAGKDCPPGRHGLLLHGLYVHPQHMRKGLGRRLLQAAAAAARTQGLDGVLVKAQADAEGFFRRLGLRELPVEDAARHYAKRYWLPT